MKSLDTLKPADTESICNQIHSDMGCFGTACVLIDENGARVVPFWEIEKGTE